MKILIVEDDTDTRELIRDALTSHSHTSDISADGADGSFLARTYEYDAIILDYSLPKKDGLTVCKEIRAAHKTTPIIFLSSTDDVDIKVKALEAGADDYMVKPFSLNELHARLKAITRRPKEIQKNILCVEDLTLDTETHLVIRGTTPIHLTRKEFNLLEYLMRTPGIIVSRALIIEHVWTADSDPFSNTVEAHIRNIRKKINTGSAPDLIGNIPGRGYIIDSPERLKRIVNI